MTDDLQLALLLSLTGLFTSALSGVAGLGGGTILIGVFYALGLAPVEAIPLFAAVQLVSNLTRTAAYVRHVEWRAAGWFLLAAIPATALLAPFAATVSVHVIQLILAALIAISLLPDFFAGQSAGQTAKPLPPRLAFVAAGAANGALGMFVGATGLFVGRLFLRPEWPKQKVVATLALTQVFGHGLRVIAYGLVGFSALAKPQLLLPVCGSVIVGTLLGKQLNGRLSEVAFRKLFQGILIVLTLKLAYDGLHGLWN
ncbi:MAG: sulfite exporter TauE/SafE family protein [Pseudomonadota bacterium]